MCQCHTHRVWERPSKILCSTHDGAHRRRCTIPPIGTPKQRLHHLCRSGRQRCGRVGRHHGRRCSHEQVQGIDGVGLGRGGDGGVPQSLCGLAGTRDAGQGGGVQRPREQGRVLQPGPRLLSSVACVGEHEGTGWVRGDQHRCQGALHGRCRRHGQQRRFRCCPVACTRCSMYRRFRNTIKTTRR